MFHAMFPTMLLTVPLLEQAYDEACLYLNVFAPAVVRRPGREPRCSGPARALSLTAAG